jgi:hypothetical protein
MEGRIARYATLPSELTRNQLVDLLTAMHSNVYVSYLDPKVPLLSALREGIDRLRPHHIIHGKLNGVGMTGISLENFQWFPFNAMPALGLAGEKREGGVLIVRRAEGGELVYANPKRAELIAQLTEAQRALIEKEEAMVRLLSSREQFELNGPLNGELRLLRDSPTNMHDKKKPSPNPA